MTKIATMGTSSCATFAMSGFKDQDLYLEMEYLDMKNEDKTAIDNKVSEVVEDWYQNILYPVKQPLGETDNYPFSCLMKAISNHEYLNKKFLITTLNGYQVQIMGEGYWIKTFKDWEFKFLRATANSTMDDGINYIFCRDLAERNKKPKGW